MAAGFAQCLNGWSNNSVRLYDGGAVQVGLVNSVAGDSAISIARRVICVGASLFGGDWQAYPLANGTIRIASSGAALWSLAATGVVATRTKLPGVITAGPTIDGSGPHDDGLYLSVGVRVGGVEVKTSSSNAAAASSGMGGAPVLVATQHQVSAWGTLAELYTLEETVVGKWDVWTDDPVSLPRLWIRQWTRSPVSGNRDPSYMVARTTAAGVA